MFFSSGDILKDFQTQWRTFSVLFGLSVYGNYYAVGDLYPYFILHWLLAIELMFLRHLDHVYNPQPDRESKPPEPLKSLETKVSHIEIEMPVRGGRISTTEAPVEINEGKIDTEVDLLKSSSKPGMEESIFRNVSLDSPNKYQSDVFDLFDELNQVGTIGMEYKTEENRASSKVDLRSRKSVLQPDAQKKDKARMSIKRKSQFKTLTRSMTKRDFERRSQPQPTIDLEKLGIKPKMENILEGQLEKAEIEADDQNVSPQLFSKHGPTNLEKLSHRDLKSLLIKDMSIGEKKKLIDYYKRFNIVNTINTRLGLIKLVERLLLLVVFFSSNSKRNLFSIFYLLFAIYYWHKSKSFYYVRHLTNFFAFMIIIQYLFLVLNISYPFTSPYPLPTFTNETIQYSVLEGILPTYNSSEVAVEGLNFVGFGTMRMDGGTPLNGSNVTISGTDPVTEPLPNPATYTLVTDSIVFLFVQAILWLYLGFFNVVLTNLFQNGIAAFNKQVEKTLELVNYQNWRDMNYRILRKFTKFVFIHFQRVAILVIIAIAVNDSLTMNLVILIVAVYYMLLTEFIVNKFSVPNRQILMVKFLTFAQFFTLIYLLWACMNKLQLDFFPLKTFNNANFTTYSTQDKITMFILLQMILDLLQSKNYVKFHEEHLKKFSIRARMISLCTIYDFNDKKVAEIIKDYANKKTLNERLENVSEQLKV